MAFTFSTSERTALNPLTDTLTARRGEKGATFLVYTSPEHGRHAWAITDDRKGRSAGELLAMAWRIGSIALGGWVFADQFVPTHEHDCTECVFLGAVDRNGRHGDVYACPQGPGTVLVRWSSEPSDNTTTPLSAMMSGRYAWQRDAAEMVALFQGVDLPATFFLTDPRDTLDDPDYSGDKCAAHDSRTCACS